MKLQETAVLMRLAIGMPGEARQDPELSGQVKAEHQLGQGSGRWVKTLYPPEALAPIKKLDNEARAYHESVTLPFDRGIGILPAALIVEHSDRMREFKGKREHLVQSHFLANYQQWIEWARGAHNGTFDADCYPPVEKIAEAFYFRTEPLPVPDASHFVSTVTSLLGVDAQSVDLRIADATQEAQRELMRRMMAPVKAMAAKLSEQPKGDKDCPVFRDTLIGNLKEIAELAPKLNLSGDTAIDEFASEIAQLSSYYTPQELRQDGSARQIVANKAAETLKRLEAYKL